MRKVREDGTLVWVRESAKAVRRTMLSGYALLSALVIADGRRWMGTWARSGPLGSGGSYVATVSAPIQRGVRRIRLVSRERSLTPGQG